MHHYSVLLLYNNAVSLPAVLVMLFPCKLSMTRDERVETPLILTSLLYRTDSCKCGTSNVTCNGPTKRRKRKRQRKKKKDKGERYMYTLHSTCNCKHYCPFTCNTGTLGIKVKITCVAHNTQYSTVTIQYSYSTHVHVHVCGNKHCNM